MQTDHRLAGATALSSTIQQKAKCRPLHTLTSTPPIFDRFSSIFYPLADSNSFLTAFNCLPPSHKLTRRSKSNMDESTGIGIGEIIYYNHSDREGYISPYDGSEMVYVIASTMRVSYT
jgi:hypothetical protein